MIDEVADDEDGDKLFPFDWLGRFLCIFMMAAGK
jgi:hypothetical protein